MASPSMGGWRERGSQVLYFDADDRRPDQPGKRELPHDGRGVLTFYGEDGKESWAPPADDIRLIWDAGYKQWRLYVPGDEHEPR